MHISLTYLSISVPLSFSLSLSTYHCVLLPSTLTQHHVSVGTQSACSVCPPVVSAGRFHGAIYGARFGLLAFCRFLFRLGVGWGPALSLLRFPGQAKQKYEFIPFFSCCFHPTALFSMLCFFCTGKFLEHNVIYSWELCAKKDAAKQSTSRRIGANRGNQQKGIGGGIER